MTVLPIHSGSCPRVFPLRLATSRAGLFITITLLLLTVWPANAASILAIVSARNAADVLGGTHRFLDEVPDSSVVLRSTEQFASLEDDARRKLLAKADLVFAGAVFGVAAEQLLDYLSASNADASIKSFVALHGDPRLSAASHLNGRSMLINADMDALMADQPLDAEVDISAWVDNQISAHTEHANWLTARLFWSGRGTENSAGLMRHLTALAGDKVNVPRPSLPPALRAFVNEQEIAPDALSLDDGRRWIAVLDHDTGDRPGEIDTHHSLCNRLEARGHGCLSLLADWGEASVEAVNLLAQHADSLAAIVSLQNFVIGAGEGRERVDAALATLDVPVLKGIRLTDRTRAEWQLSEEGLPQDSVHYRVAMPELQGISQPLVISAMSPATIDQRTGLALAVPVPINEQIQLLERRVNRWVTLQSTPASERRVAIVYYNHPPGRHNIGADNLNVPASLLSILHRFRDEGYHTGPLPDTEDALLDMLQDRGVNLPENRTAMADMSSKVANVNVDTYAEWFKQLPASLRGEMINGPLGYLQVQMRRALALNAHKIGQDLLERVVLDLRHAIEGADHPARARAINLLAQLQTSYTAAFDVTGAAPSLTSSAMRLKERSELHLARADELIEAIVNTDVEGVRGWGKPPGRIMVHEQAILLPGIRFGNIFIGPQPPRGWELNEEILHANLSFPPTHQYFAFYRWIRDGFSADAVVHLGRHSTLEFLPRHRAGLGGDDYPLALLDDLPNVYPYIVDGVGEGIQAKRRAMAVIVDHLTPPLESTALYDRLLELRQLVESHEAAPASAVAMRQRATEAIKTLVDELELEEELMASMSGELDVRGITTFEQVDEELLVHEVGHYLTRLQEDFMPLGLHAFGSSWSREAVDTMLNSMAGDNTKVDATASSSDPAAWRKPLMDSPDAEMNALLTGLAGRYVRPGKGNDPIRTPEVLPTGRNFFALDGGLVPSRLGYQTGVELATIARARSADGTSGDSNADADADADAIVLWASDVVRDEGAMIAFGLDMLGVHPVWSSRGIVRGLERFDIAAMSENGAPRVRRDTVYTTSGLFRDLYGEQLIRLEEAVLMALDASANVIYRDYPALSVALNAALAPLGEKRSPGDEALDINRVAARWTRDAAHALRHGIDAAEAGRTSALRVFGDAPGTYGAGVNRMVERSGSWQERSEIAATYQRRMGHAYGAARHGEPLHDAFKQRLASVGNTWAGQSSNLYGLLDNNDMFDYLGGLSLAIEHVQGEAPANFVLQHADGDKLRIEPLATALMSELRGRFLNPQWLLPQMDEGYAGARTMGSEFIEYLWGWQVTNPDIVRDWAWDEVKSVYIDDAHGIGLDTFLEEGHNVHVKSNMLAVMLVAVQKGFWDADAPTVKALAEDYVNLVVTNGLPGSGHTAVTHPLHDWLEDRVDPDAYAQLRSVLDKSRVAPEARPAAGPATIAEISLSDSAQAEASANLEAKAKAQAKTETDADADAIRPTSGTPTADSSAADTAVSDSVAVNTATPDERHSLSTDSYAPAAEGPTTPQADASGVAEHYGAMALGALAILILIGGWHGSRGPAAASIATKG